MAANENPLALVLSDLPLAVPSREQIQKLPKFNEAIVELGKIRDQLLEIDRHVREMKIVTKADFDVAKALSDRRKQLVKDAEAVVDPYKEPLQKYIKVVQQAFNIIKNQAEATKGYSDPKMDVWSKADERRRQEEQRKLQAQVDADNKRQAEADRQAKIADLKKSHKAGMLSPAAYKREMQAIGAEFEEALQSAPAVEVEKTKTGGRTYYHAACAERLAFIKEFVLRYNAGDMSMLRFIAVDDSELDAVAAELKDSVKMVQMYPNVKAWHETKY